MAMSDEMKAKLKEAMKAEAGLLIDKDFEAVLKNYGSSLSESETPERFAYNVGVTVTLKPIGADIRVTSKLSAPRSAFKDETPGHLVSREDDMFEED